MSVIWKEEISLNTDLHEIMLPSGAEILYAREQKTGGNPDKICIWFRCDPMQPTTPRTICLVGTGHPCPGPEGRYLGSAHLNNDTLILHVFEKLHG